METPALLVRAREWWGKLPAAQKLLLGGLALAAIAAVAVWAVFFSQPRYIALDTGAIEARDAAEVTAKLKELKVPYRLGADGLTILVPTAEKPAAVLALAQAGLPRGGAGGYELWDSQKFGATDQDRRVLFKRAMEGELSRAITRLVGVQYANVKLALPEPSLFITQEKAATAAVIVGTRPSYSLTSAQVAGVIRFVSGALEGMRPENVTVIDERGRVLSAGLPSADAEGPSGADGLKAQLAAQDELQHKVQALLEPVFGPGNVVAQVALTLNWDKVQTESTTYGASTPQTTTSTSRDVTTTGGAATVIDQGLGSNVAGGPGNGGVPSYQAGLPGGGTTTINENANNTTNAVSSEKRTVLSAPGAIKTISVGVLVNQRDGVAALSTDQANQVRSTVAKATGAALTDVSITAIPFNQDLQKLLAPDVKPGSPWTASLLIALAVGVGGALLLVLLLRRRSEPAVAYSEMVPALGGIPLPDPAAAEAPDAPAAAAALQESEDQEADRILAEMARNLENPARNRLKLYVEHMAKRSPELVASLLRSWLSED